MRSNRQCTVLGVILTTACSACANGSNSAGSASSAEDYTGADPCTVTSSAPLEWTCTIAADLILNLTFVGDTGASANGGLLRIVPLRGRLRPLTITPAETYDFTAETITAADLDADGVRELMIRRDIGHPNNSGYDIWYYDPPSRTLRLDSIMSGETNVSADSVGCVHTSAWLGGVNAIERRYCHTGDRRWFVIWEHVQAADSDGTWTNREYRLIDGSLRLVAEDTVP